MPDAGKAITRSARTGGATLGHRPFAKVLCEAMTRGSGSMPVIGTTVTDVVTRVEFSAESSAGLKADQ